MIEPQQHHYRIVRYMFWATSPQQAGLSVSHLASRMMIDEFECDIYLSQMANPEFSEFGPWVERIGAGRWAILGVQRDNNSTGGYLALEIAKKNVYLKDESRRWAENVRAGMDAKGDETEVENAAIPAFTRAKKPVDPESSAKRANDRFVSQEKDELEVDENGDRLCPMCPPWRKKPVHKKSRFCREHKRRRNRQYRTLKGR